MRVERMLTAGCFAASIYLNAHCTGAGSKGKVHYLSIKCMFPIRTPIAGGGT